MQTGWRIGSLFGIPFFVDPSWLIILTFVTFAYGSEWQSSFDLYGTNAGGGFAWVLGLGMALLLFASVLLHELGHSLVARSQGIQVSSITLFLFGGIASIDRESETPNEALQVAIAGPAVSIVLFVLLSLTAQIDILPPTAQIIASNIAQINLVLALFNLIPGLPLDGGQILKSIVWKATGDQRQGVRWAARVGQFLGWTAIVVGVVAFFTTFSLTTLWIAFIGGFCVRNASAYSRVNDLQEALSDITSTDAMTRDFRVVDADMTLRQFADQHLLLADQRVPAYFAVSNGRYRGMVSIDDLRSTERSEWELRTLHDIAHPLTEIPSIRESTPIAEVIDALESRHLKRLTVLTPADAVAGIVDRGDIVRALAKKLNLQISEDVIQRIKEDGTYPPGLQLPALSKAING